MAAASGSSSSKGSSITFGEQQTERTRQTPTKENIIEVRGRLIKMCPNGDVLLKFSDKCGDFNLLFSLAQLSGLDLYTGTEALSKLASLNPDLMEEYIVQLDENAFVKFKNKGLEAAKIVRLYQDYPHGRVDMNIQIRNQLWKMFQSEVKLEEEPKEAKFLTTDDFGNIWFQLCTCVTDRVIDYFKTHEFPKFEAETRETLMRSNIMTNVYVAPYRSEKGLYRIKIHMIMSAMIHVEYIDFQEFQNIKIENIFDASKIDENFASFPPLCIQGHLMGITAVNDEVLQIQPNEIIQVQLACFNDPPQNFGYTNGKVNVPEVYVNIQNKIGKWIDLNNLLINCGAVAEIPPTSRNTIGGCVYMDEDDDIDKSD